MNILIVLHASFEKPGSIEIWAEKNGHQVYKVRPYKDEDIPDINMFDFLILMGGPQSPLEIEKFPYLYNEIELIKQAIKKNKRILGICLGAQLIGEAMGAKTERSPQREIGMYPIELLDDASDDPIFCHFPARFDVMHWHNDMPGIPDGAVLLAKSEGCPRQVFRFGDRIYGFQCHFEFNEEIAKAMVKHCSNDLKERDHYISTTKEILEIDYSQINLKMDNILDKLVNLPEKK